MSKTTEKELNEYVDIINTYCAVNYYVKKCKYVKGWYFSDSEGIRVLEYKSDSGKEMISYLQGVVNTIRQHQIKEIVKHN